MFLDAAATNVSIERHGSGSPGAVGIEQDLAGLASLQPLHAFAEVFHRNAISNHRMQIELARSEQRGHLIPGLVHQAAIDALNGCAFEDDVVGEVQFNWLRRNAEEGDAAAEAQNLESCSDCVGLASHLQHHVY